MTLIDRTRGWIDTQGYPLELEVAEALRKVGMWWDHGRVYEDLHTGKVREIDLTGTFAVGSASAQLIIECKHSRDKPWVMFATDRPAMNDVGFVRSTPGTKSLRGELEALSSMPEIQNLSMFRRPSDVGFTLVRAHSDSRDAAYHAVQSPIAACASIARRLDARDSRMLLLPTVVVDTPLMICKLTESSPEYSLEEVDFGRMLVPTGDGERVPISVVTLRGLRNYLEDLLLDAEALGGRLS